MHIYIHLFVAMQIVVSIILCNNPNNDPSLILKREISPLEGVLACDNEQNTF